MIIIIICCIVNHELRKINENQQQTENRSMTQNDCGLVELQREFSQLLLAVSKKIDVQGESIEKAFCPSSYDHKIHRIALKQDAIIAQATVCT